LDERKSYEEWRNRTTVEDVPEPVPAAPEQTPQADYDAWRDKQMQNAAERAAIALDQATEGDVAAGIDRSDQARQQGLNIPAEMLTDVQSELTQQIDRTTRFQTLLQSSRLSGWIVSDPVNAALAKRDLENLSALEGLVGSAGRGGDRATTGTFARMQTKAAEKNLGALQRAMQNQDKTFGEIATEIDENIEPRDRLANMGLNTATTYGKAAVRFLTSRVAGAFDEETLNGFEETLTAELDNALRIEGENAQRINAQYGRSVRVRRIDEQFEGISELESMTEQVASLGQLIASEPGAFAEWLANVVVESGPSLAAAGAVTVATRNPAAGAAAMGVTSGSVGQSLTFQKLVDDAGYDLTDPAQRAALIADPEFRTQLNDRAFAYGAVIGIMDAASGGIASRTLLSNPAGDLIAQSLVQAAMGSGGETLALLASDQPLNMAEIIVEGLAEFVTAPIEAAAVGNRVYRAKREAREDVEFFEALAQSADGSELKKQAPKKYREAVAALTKDGPVENVYVNAQDLDELFQSTPGDVTAEQFVRALPGVDYDAYAAALETGGTVEIPTGTYAAEIAGTDFDKLIREHLKTTPEKMSAAEAREFEKQAASLLETASQTVDDLDSGRRALEGATEELRQQLVSDLRAQGQTEKVAQNNALQISAFVATQAQRMNVTPEEFVRKYAPPEVRGAMGVEQSAPQIAATPEFVERVRNEPDSDDDMVQFVRQTALDAGVNLAEATDADIEQAVVEAYGPLASSLVLNQFQRAAPRQVSYDVAAIEARAAELAQTMEKLPGAPSVEGASGPDPYLNAVAEAYAAAHGLKSYGRQSEFAQVDEDRAERIAEAYENMEHNPESPVVQAQYRNLIEQTRAQYDALVAAGYEFWFMSPEADPYKGNPWNAMRDLRGNRTMAVFPTEGGYGSGATELDTSDNPLLLDTGLEWSYGSPDGEKRRVLANDLFRAVHDAFGHGLEGAGFRARGEENAWQAHARMFRPNARNAMTAETRGQNSWLNYGPEGENNRTAGIEDTVFADQKAGTMPGWAETEGFVPNEPRDIPTADGKITLTHWSNAPRETLTVATAGTGPLRGTERGRGGPKKLYFGINVGGVGGYVKESLGPYKHTVEVDADKMYDFDNDPEGYWGQVPDNMAIPAQMGWVEQRAKDDGYSGYYVRTGPQGMSAVLFEDATPTEVVDERAVVLNQSATPLFDNPVDAGKNPTIKAVAEKMDDFYRAAYGRKLDPNNSEEDYQIVLDAITEEFDAQISEPNSGVGWYSRDVGEALGMASQVYPTLATDQTHRDLFLTFAGIFSNGMTPQQAFATSAEAFELFLENGEVPVNRGGGTKWGVRDNNNRAQLDFVRSLAEREGSLTAAMEWLKNPQPRADIDQAMRDFGYHKKGRFVTKKALAGADTPGMLAFGEKLGRYTMGLHGLPVTAEDVTIDLWYTRTYRRLTGGLLDGPIGSEGIVSGPTNKDREVIRRMTGDLAEMMEMEVGDVQAVLWFFEKRLWGAQGIDTQEGTNSDGARKLLEAKGFTERDDGDRSSRADRELAVSYGEEFFQRKRTGPRGSIILPADPTARPVISLFETADLSTFLHESGHFFLYTLQQMEANGADTDLATVREWWGQNVEGVAEDGGVTVEQAREFLEKGTTGDAEVDRKVNTGMQEQWARAYETYLMEGKAPSNALRSAFEAFSAWLLSVYRRVKGDLNVNVSDEMRGVFDRMLATDEEIAAVAEANSMDTMLASSAEALGIDQVEYEKLVRLGGEAQDEARQQMQRDIMAPIRAQRTKEYREERAQVREEIAAKVHAKPANRVREWLGNERWIGADDENPNPRKLPLDLRISRQSVIDDYGQAVLDALPRGKRPLTTKETTLTADDVAGWFGYKSGSEMLQDVSTSPNAEKEIDNLTRVEMRKRYESDPLVDGTIEEKAVKALHGEKRGQLIAAELRALNKTAKKGKATTRAQARLIARRLIRTMPIRKAVRSGQYLAAERRAAERSQQLVAKGDLVAAYEAKREQLLNNALYMESKAADEMLAKAEKKAASLKKKSVRKNLAGEYLDAIDDILTSYDFRKSTTAKAEQRRAGLIAYMEMMKEQGRENELAIPEHVIDEAQRKPYKTLTTAELEGVYDSLRNIEHTARMKQKLRDAQNERDFTEVVEGIVDEMDANVKDASRNRVKTRGERVKDGVRETANLLLSADTILRKLGGFERGKAYDAIKENLDDAANWAQVEREKAFDKFEELYGVYTKKEQRQMGVKKRHDVLKGSFSKWDLISIALNMGNEDNLNRLMDKDSGRGFNASQVEYVKQQLTERDWQFVQNSWGYINSFWPLIEARERRITGVAPKKVQASEVETPYGTYPGGYYPIRYDGDMSGVVGDEQFEDILQNMRGGRFGKAQTKNGHLQERANGSGGRVLQLGIEVMHMHVGQVIHDLAFSEPVVNAWRVIQDPRVRGAFERKGLLQDHRALEVWLQDAAVGQISGGGVWGRLALRAKNGFTLSKLAFNASTVMLQFTGVAQSAVVVGHKNLALGYSDYLSNPIRTSREVVAMSPFMAERETTFNRDVNDILNDISVGPAASNYQRFQQGLARVGFFAMQKAQFYGVDVPTWYAGYRQGLQKFGNDEAKARKHADRMVARAQASGVITDRSAFERGSTSRDTRQNGFIRLFTALGSYMFAKGNIAYEVVGVARRDIDGANVRSLAAALKGASDLILLFTVEAVAYHMIKGTLPDSEEDPDDTWGKFLARETALSMMSTVPGIRDLGSSLSGFDAGAYGSVISTFTRPLLQMEQGEVDAALLKSVSNAAGVLTGLPSGQLNKTADAWYRLESGEDISPVEFLMGANR
jgi:hypothetical protein